MKYFTYDLIAAANDWVEQTEEARLEAEQQFRRAALDYHNSLANLKARISQEAWKFFEFGYGPSGLHDGRLVSLAIGDGLEYRVDGRAAFRLKHQRTAARILFLNYEQDRLYTFELRGINSVRTDLTRCEAPNWCLGDLYTYEIIAVDDSLLQLGFLFATGSSIVVQFIRLVFRRQRIRRRYPPGDMYR